MKYSGWPEPGELVVGEVDEIADFGVFVDLDEYEDKRGLCHISEVASGWIKNVRDHVREGQTVVAKVLEIDESSNQIDLSIKDVNEHQRKETIQDWKNAQKADNWMLIALGEDVDDDRYTTVANALLAEYESLYDAFEAAAISGDEALDDVDVDGDTVDAIVTAARNNVSVPYVDVTGYVDLESAAPDGVDDVRDALAAAEGNGEIPDGVDLDVGYVGSPEYRIKVRAPNYKTAESQLEAAAERARESIEAAGGAGEFHRERREDDE
ncbi:MULTISPECIES: translation initiation factor IF-2 subunit alpha [Halorubrum]|uniref:Translation initiation factor 2 subunit alpha n=2 Tax=Halorubrum ezzemoulense TaxID=337243 RepID=A0A256JRD1_HALEZ|nr:MULTISPECIES: translation initiation factor IF-2 subunit alpha [Halorubrum]MDB2225458.1 translation initiation factor IF-2 subunit alpha [Halorubrum ezzemoulense]MDB9232586.1 translation initiation factor IF-2 subunit alpha [Halorubrum ezzemoulense]MDB9251901.1 translation initiation factor IF-2 subunit alpha [Halorubrum ezzemoulense]MDB9254535.1 translation initiation factor IF-2 subunit alpha [Halorubrum ezzemoulense]MDB9275246.1 translation initiation factor IF-2 subunit alpha [Halorubru